MTREEELNQAIDNMTNVIEAARYLFVEINADNTEAILREQARLEKVRGQKSAICCRAEGTHITNLVIWFDRRI